MLILILLVEDQTRALKVKSQYFLLLLFLSLFNGMEIFEKFSAIEMLALDEEI